MKSFKVAICVIAAVCCTALCPDACWRTASAQEQSREQELFFVAQKAFDDGFYDVAIRYIEQFFHQFPASSRYSQARLLLGQCYFFKNQYLKALELFQSVQHDPAVKDAAAYWLGEAYFKGGDYRQARTFYARVIDDHPDSEYIPQAYYSLGWASFSQGDYPQAVEYFKTLAETYPGHGLSEDALFKTGEAYLNMSRYDHAIEVFEKYTAQNPKSPRLANAFFYLGESCYYTNDLLKANTYYARAAELTKDPSVSLMSQVGMGWIYLKLKKYGLSEGAFDEAEETSRRHSLSSAEVLLGRGTLRIETERFSDALDSYDIFLRLYPKHERVHDAMAGKAKALYLLERYDDAIAVYRSLIDYANQHSLAQEIIEQSYYGMAWSYLKQGKAPQAIQTFQAIMEHTLSPVVKASALTQIGDAYQDIKQFSQALMAYDRVLKEFSDGPYADYAQFQQGITLLKMGNEESATFSFQSLKKNFPNSTYLHESDYYLGFASFQNQEWPQVIRYISSFLESPGASSSFLVQAKYILALAYFYQRDFTKAFDLFQDIVARVADQPSVKQTAEVHIGKCLYHLNRPAEAVRYFQQICQNYPLSDAHQDSLLWLGSFYLSQSDFSNASAQYQAFIEQFPGSEKIDAAYYELGQTFYGMGSLEQALNAFHQVTDANSDIFAKARLAVADIFSQDADSRQAVESYRKIADGIPDYRRDALVKIAKIAVQRDDVQEALTAYQEALDAGKGRSGISDAELIFAAADLYELQNQHQRAVEEYLKIPYLHQEETAWVIRAYLRAARILENSENWDEAAVAYEKVIALDAEESAYARERLDEIQSYVQGKH